MADNEEGGEAAPRGNEWEVVSLTASAYAAAPGPQQVESINDNQDDGGKSALKDEENVSIRELMTDEFPGIQIFDDKGNRLSASGAYFEKDVVFDKEKNIYNTTEFSSFHCESTIPKSDTVEEGGETDYSLVPEDHGLDSGVSNFQKPDEGEKYDAGGLPCEAWWKRRAVSLYAHAKEANTFWSIFVAAAVMGLVIIGHHWQQERWQVLHLKWQFGISDERMGRVLGPISRFKDVIVGGHRRGSLVRGSTSTER
ncbi:ATG8-interacting protein 1 isoform X3 [Sesamum indicum]|uniref:ATG8-interacting protein 1 isoform X3 n=1 Tax=Sesamum indicum TaxID=4182 RepID=A0A6I9UB76_SESIN|nr:ATG8-interacting protein 1 isoform X3 [Sesamum indicum]